MRKLTVLAFPYTDNLTDGLLIELAKGLGTQLEKLHLECSTAKHLNIFRLKKMLPFATKLSFISLNSINITFDLNIGNNWKTTRKE